MYVLIGGGIRRFNWLHVAFVPNPQKKFKVFTMAFSRAQAIRDIILIFGPKYVTTYM